MLLGLAGLLLASRSMWRRALVGGLLGVLVVSVAMRLIGGALKILDHHQHYREALPYDQETSYGASGLLVARFVFDHFQMQ